MERVDSLQVDIESPIQESSAFRVFETATSALDQECHLSAMYAPLDNLGAQNAPCARFLLTTTQNADDVVLAFRQIELPAVLTGHAI